MGQQPRGQEEDIKEGVFCHSGEYEWTWSPGIKIETFTEDLYRYTNGPVGEFRSERFSLLRGDEGRVC